MIAGQCWELQLLSLTSWKRLRIILENQLFSTIRAEETRPLMVHSPCGLGTESQTQRSKRNDSQFRGSHKLGKNNMYKKDQLEGDDSKSDSRSDYWAHNGIYRCWVPRKHTWPLSKVIQWCFLLGKTKTKTYISAGFDLLSPNQKCWLPHIYWLYRMSFVFDDIAWINSQNDWTRTFQ